MTTPRKANRDQRLPDRMRDYRIEAELRESPDLHQLAQLFIGMARSRAEQARTHQQPPGPSSPGPVRGDEVESDM